MDQLAKARKLMTDAQFIAFLKAADECEDVPITSVRMTIEDLTEGRSLDELFETSDQTDLHTVLEVIGKGDHFEISFGHQGPHAGDGGTWLVRFEPDGTVTILGEPICWIC